MCVCRITYSYGVYYNIIIIININFFWQHSRRNEQQLNLKHTFSIGSTLKVLGSYYHSIVR